MGTSAGGALNTAGFSYAIQNKQIPSHQHITHAGTFNEQFFEVGHKAQQLLQLYYSIAVSNCQLFGLPKRNYFLSLFLKSIKDGLPRTRSINACIVLDISGSMNSPLSYTQQNHKTRLMLARDAIFMFFQKLTQNDVFSLVVFHNEARTVIQSNYVKQMNIQKVKKAIYQQFQSGGTTIKNGFNQALKQINTFKSDLTNYQNRIVMLTDVCDNSVADQHILIKDISQNNSVGTTIIGVSSDFKASTCQKLKQVRGFNYFCAVKNQDLQTFLVNRFDYTFFPCVQNITIKLISDHIESIKVYGSADQDVMYEKQKQCFLVTKVKSIFPSQIIQNKVKKDQIQSLGGLLLVKFVPKNQQVLPEIDIKVILEYQDLQGHKFNKQYVIKQKISAEEYYSGKAIKKGVSLFYYAQSMRNLLKVITDNLSQANKAQYINNLKQLADYCPQSKKAQLEKVIEIVNEK